MNLSVTRSSEVFGAIDAGCDRLVHPCVRDEGERAAQRRLIGILLVAPFFAAASIALFMAGTFGAAMTLTAICATFGVAWVSVLLIAATGQGRVCALTALTAGALLLSAVVSAAGGLSSPMAVLLLALPLEAWWQKRSLRAAGHGVAAALAVLPLQALLGSAVFPAATSVAGWHWLVPIAYVATLLPRLDGFFARTSQDAGHDERSRLEDMIDAVVLRLTPNGDIADVSAQAREMMRLQPELLLGTGLFDRIHVSDRVAYLCALADLRGGAARRKVEVRLRLPRLEDGPTDNYRPFLIELMSKGIGAGAFTALVRENEEVAELRADLANAGESAEALEIAKGRFLAAVSHELRTPLNAIIGFSDMLLHETFGGFQNPRQKEYVTLVRDSGHHLLEVVNSILDVSRIEAGTYATNPESFRFADAVEMCRSMMNLQADAKTISLTTRIAPETGEIHADRRAVQQILINLVSNAIKFTPSGGQVSVGAKRLGSWLHFWVSDTGIGIADQDLCRLGKPFTQVQNDYTRQFEGTGLGLSLVKGLVTLHEGTMSIESAVGQGTTVTITLPVAGPATAEGTEERGSLVPLRIAGESRKEGHGSLRKAG